MSKPSQRSPERKLQVVLSVLRDWCRIWGTHTAYIEPGSPSDLLQVNTKP